MTNNRNRDSNAEGIGSEIKLNLDDEVDALFKLPLAEFIGARTDVAARLKRGGRADDANLIKALAKPSVSAWAVNQLYWNHRKEFDRLLAAGQRIRQAQATPTAAQIAGMRESLEARREAISHLSELGAALLREAGHNPTLDMINRITTTLEAVSAGVSISDGPRLGRLTRDLDPPGFDSLPAMMASGGTPKAKEEPKPLTPSQESRGAATRVRQPAAPAVEVQKTRQLEDTRQRRIAAAKVSVQGAQRLLIEASARARQLEAAQKKAFAEANQAEKELRELEERLKKASVASRDAAERSQSTEAQAKEAAKAVEDAKRNLEEASKALESLRRE